MTMSFAPRHDYELIERAASSARLSWLQSASPEAKFNRYSEVLALTMGAGKPSIKLVSARRRWLKEKRKQRVSLLAILKHLDQKRG